MKVEIPTVDGNPTLIAAQIEEELHGEDPSQVYARITILQAALHEVLKRNRKVALADTTDNPLVCRHGTLQVSEKPTYDYSGDEMLKGLTTQVNERRAFLRGLSTTPVTFKKELKWIPQKKEAKK